MIKNKNKKFVRTKILVFLLLISFILADFLAINPKTAIAQDDLNSLSQQIEKRKKDIDILQKEIDAYNAQIKDKQNQAKSLKNQLAILDNQIAKINLDIEETEIRIEQTNLEIQSLNIQIQQTEKKITDNKSKIAEYLRLINHNDQVSYLEVVLTNDSFSDFFDQIKYTQEIHSNLNSALKKLKNSKNDLETQKTKWQEKAELEGKLKDQLQEQKSQLSEKSSAQEILLIQNKLTEKQYKSYLYQLQIEQQQINADIVTLEKTVRQKLEEQQKQSQLQNSSAAGFIWPVNPAKGISAIFHDPDYPFRYIYEHPGIDIRTPQGTTIKSVDSGYVARVKFNGDTSYAYIMIIHANGLSSVYGHVSRVNVKEDEYVNQGQVIGASGATPGTTGAGKMTTGPHLHLEIRLNGIPVNPLDYLP
ncbi:MAG: peptidoglycan DD-metalloendopeptidase family protein [Candidatus Buchananbacteria bacterium]